MWEPQTLSAVLGGWWWCRAAFAHDIWQMDPGILSDMEGGGRVTERQDQ